MKIYQVISSIGNWDDHYWKNEGLFLNPANAEEFKSKILSGIECDKNTECPIKGLNYDSDINDSMSEVDGKKFYDWWFAVNAAEDFNECKVEEHETKD